MSNTDTDRRLKVGRWVRVKAHCEGFGGQEGEVIHRGRDRYGIYYTVALPRGPEKFHPSWLEVVEGGPMRIETELAQDALMQAMQTAIAIAANEQPQAIRDEMVRQFRRVEKLFRYEPGSWVAGV